MHRMTRKGLALLAKQQVGLAEPNISRIVAGTGFIDHQELQEHPELLEQLTEVLDPVADMEMGQKQLVDGKIVRLPAQLSNHNLSQTALVYQLGSYSIDPDEGEILYQIVQYEHAVPIPAYAVNNGGVILFEPEIDLLFANGELASVPLSPGFLLTMKQFLRTQPTALIATIEHQLEGVPICTLYRTEDALGTLPFGEGPYGGGGRMDTPYRFRLLPGRQIEVYVTPEFAALGTPAVIWCSKYRCNLMFEGSRINLTVELRD